MAIEGRKSEEWGKGKKEGNREKKKCGKREGTRKKQSKIRLKA